MGIEPQYFEKIFPDFPEITSEENNMKEQVSVLLFAKELLNVMEVRYGLNLNLEKDPHSSLQYQKIISD